MSSEPRSVTVLGSTGSVGRQTIDLLAGDPQRFQIRALVANRNAQLLAQQAILLHAQHAVVCDASAYTALKQALAGTSITAAAGPDAVVEAAARPADWTMAAITGAAGLSATLAAIRRGACVALANKEALVCAGDVMLQAVREAGATLLPVDSEHNAIFQALAENNHGAVERIVLTASGGPFRTASREEMAAATPEAALKHPVWSMGAKISIDSATLMNKGLEVIEAARLFGWSTPNRWSTASSATRTAACWRNWVRRTCGSRSPTRSPGRAGCSPPPPASTWRRERSSNSSSRTWNAFPPLASPARHCAPAPAPRPS